MIGAVIINNKVENLITLNEAQIEELSTALNCEIIDAKPYGLSIGDTLTEEGWTREVDGEQIVLELLDPEYYDSLSVAEKEITQLEKTNEFIAQTSAGEALAILSGEIE